jgi:hypothetical protein
VSLKCDQTSAQRLVQIHDQVVGILNPDRNANKRRRDTQPQPFFFRDVRMRHRLTIALLPPSLRKPIELTPNCGGIFFSRKSVPP